MKKAREIKHFRTAFLLPDTFGVRGQAVIFFFEQANVHYEWDIP
jgi:hypothetical protein